MRIAEVMVGMRVRRIGGASSLVRDEPQRVGVKPRRIGRIISAPVRLANSNHRQVQVEWEGAEPRHVETILIHRLEAVPPET